MVYIDDMKINIILVILFIGTLAFALSYDHKIGINKACAYEESCSLSPAPEITQPSSYQSEDIITPSYSPTAVESSPTPSPITPTDTPQAQINTAASANNTAGSSATVTAPTNAPDTSLRQ